MLFQLLDELGERINSMDVATEAARFATQLRKMKPSLASDMIKDGVSQDKIENLILGMSNIQMWIIKGIPAIADEMREMLHAGVGEPAFRCVLAASLAYLVQPHDLMPDDLPGGYGLIDDALLLHEAAAISWELNGDMERAEDERKLFQFSLKLVPDKYHAEFMNAINGLAVTLNIMRALDPVVAENTIQFLISNPLQPISPQGEYDAPMGLSGFWSRLSNNPDANAQRYTWESGTNMGVNFPEGGGVATDGKNIYVH